MARQGAVGVEDLILKKVLSLRRWKKTKLYKSRSKWDFQFTIMTYNILSQNAVENHRYLYRNCNPTYLQEDYRISRIMPEVLKSRSDIICLQEVEQNLFDSRIKQVFDSNGFASIFKRRTGSKSDGCAILWRRKKFHLVQQKAVEFRTKANQLLDRDNIGLIAVLKPNHPKFTNMLLHVATTHLLFNPRRGDIKLCQLRWFFAELERLSLKEVNGETRLYHPIILCGDFNIEPNSPLYQFIETGCINLLNIVSGDLSGQAEGKSKGKLVEMEKMVLHNLGISEASRFEEISPKDDNLTNTAQGKAESSSTPTKIKNVETCSKSDPSSNVKALDPDLLKAMGSSTDSRWIATFLALGNKELATKIASDFKKGQPSANQVDLNRAGSSKHDSDSSSVESGLSFRHDFKLVPAYKFHNFSDKNMPITSMTGNDCNAVDHIFYGVNKKRDINSYTEGELRLLSIYTLMQADDVSELGGLPNAALGSDHISLMAHFALSTKR
ncbi:protein angel homolog 2-like [Argiope bruennichi]|uniref:protein angel homolog 2-like n=1 Tax=Argiope bruennichi TaxID=94029 RepID=UPI00249406E7|nr:protein angel homolog 2-like [Argiope bruennichi]XP_055944240.1 protein angel homolog 2-like [Argiope bruennichi]XP_055944241.1 protein angel homolog 2-like [Argiope bruennichi]